MDLTFTVVLSARSITTAPILAAGETATISFSGLTAADIAGDSVKVYVYAPDDTLIALSTALANDPPTATLDTDTAEVVAAFAACNSTETADQRIKARVLIYGATNKSVYANSAVDMVNNLAMVAQTTPIAAGETGTTAISDGGDSVAIVYSVADAAVIIATVSKPLAADYNLFATVDESTITDTGATVHISAPTDKAGYQLNWMVTS